MRPAGAPVEISRAAVAGGRCSAPTPSAPRQRDDAHAGAGAAGFGVAVRAPGGSIPRRRKLDRRGSDPSSVPNGEARARAGVLYALKLGSTP